MRDFLGPDRLRVGSESHRCRLWLDPTLPVTDSLRDWPTTTRLLLENGSLKRLANCFNSGKIGKTQRNLHEPLTFSDLNAH